MSEPDLATVRSLLDALNHGADEQMLELCDPDIELDFSRRLLDGEVYRGHDGLLELIGGIREIFDPIEITEEEAIDLGEHVLIVSAAALRGRSSGADTTARGALVWTVVNGRVKRFCFYQSKEDALADLDAG